MLQTHLMCLPPASPRSTTSSWVPSTACFVSPHPTVDPLLTLPMYDTISPCSFSYSGVLSLMGNCILLLVAYHKWSTLKPAEFFIINLSISDLGMTLSLFPLAIPSCFSHRYPPVPLFLNLHIKLTSRQVSIKSVPGFLHNPADSQTNSKQNKASLAEVMEMIMSPPPPVHTGGCLEKSPVSSTPCAESCLVCAAWPTSQPSPWSAALRSASQSTVSGCWTEPVSTLMPTQTNNHNNYRSIFLFLLSDQVTSSPLHMPASWWLECGATHLCLPSGPWHSGDITVPSLTAQPAALTGTHPTTSSRLCPTSSAFSCFAMHCPAPSSSSPTPSSCWRCGARVRPSSSTCHRRPRPPMHTRS